jgi:hypothetical protein
MSPATIAPTRSRHEFEWFFARNRLLQQAASVSSGQDTDGMPAGATQEPRNPFALGQLLAVGIAIILGMAVDGVCGIQPDTKVGRP